MAAWFNVSAAPAAVSAFVSIGIQNSTGRIQLGMSAARAVTLQTITPTTPNAGGTTASGTASLNAWSHACSVSVSNTLRTCYRDGGNAGTNTNTNANFAPFDYIGIGTRYINNVLGAYIDGLIAEVGIWNVALTQPEIASLAKGMTCDKVRPQNLVFYAPLVRDLLDARGGLTLTNINGATVADHPRIYA